jgi:hypothetical protein
VKLIFKIIEIPDKSLKFLQHLDYATSMLGICNFEKKKKKKKKKLKLFKLSFCVNSLNNKNKSQIVGSLSLSYNFVVICSLINQ